MWRTKFKNNIQLCAELYQDRLCLPNTVLVSLFPEAALELGPVRSLQSRIPGCWLYAQRSIPRSSTRTRSNKKRARLGNAQRASLHCICYGTALRHVPCRQAQQLAGFQVFRSLVPQASHDPPQAAQRRLHGTPQECALLLTAAR